MIFGLQPLSEAQLEAATFRPVEGDGEDEYVLLF